MKRVTAFVGSGRKKYTHNAVRQFLDDLQAFGDIECEMVALSDHRLGTCRGCQLCFSRGEELCPMKDDRDALLEKIAASHGVVFASPNYSFQVSGIMKIFLDRLGFIFHRPRFFGKAFTSIVVQGIYGGNKIRKYLDFVGNGLGFNTVKGSCLKVLDPISDREKQKIDIALAKQSRRFYESLMRPAYPPPTLLKLMAFRMARTSVRLGLDDRDFDYRHYKDKGWFESEYYYPARLGAGKRLVGGLFDSVARRMTKKR